MPASASRWVSRPATLRRWFYATAAARQSIDDSSVLVHIAHDCKSLGRCAQTRAGTVLDKSQLSERYSGATFLANAGVPVRIDSRCAIMHNKFLVIDGQTVETGASTTRRQQPGKTPKTPSSFVTSRRSQSPTRPSGSAFGTNRANRRY